MISEQVKALVVAHLRERYRRGLLLVARYERENGEARRNGVSFGQREALYGRRIRAGHGVLAAEAQAGIDASRASYGPEACLQDARDRYDLWEPFGYPQATLDCLTGETYNEPVPN